MRPRTIVVIALFALFTLPAFSANLIVNPSFEDPSYQVGNGVVYPINPLTVGTTAFLSGWTINSGTTGNQGMLAVYGNYLEGFVTPITFTSWDGVNHIDVTGAGLGNGIQGISQTVATQIGETYQLSFALSNMGIGSSAQYCLVNGGSCAIGDLAPIDYYDEAARIDLVINGGAPVTFTNSLDGGVNNTWQTFTTSFTATSTTTTIEFNNNSGNDAYAGLDNVFLDVAATPEPATIAMMGCGLLALGLLRNRIRRS